ncbi:MAG: alpha/beta hydrolase [Bryobacterales bacterium]|nr:alpha/beta hydrolase [Bryobacterales bacterium]
MRSLLVLLPISAGLLTAQPLAPVPYATPDTPQGSGPFPAIMVQEANLATHTVYRPAQLAAVRHKLPVIAWGNGACVNLGNRFRYFLTEIASHGFMAIAIGPIGPAESEIAPRPPAAAAPATPPRTAPATQSSQLLDAYAWAAAENVRAGSPYKGKLDLSRFAVMGQSCGGVQALAVSHDPRVKLTGVWNSGLLPPPDPNAPPRPAMEFVPKSQLARLHAPVFIFTGDQANDIAYPNGLDDFQRLQGVTSFHAYKDGLPHAGTYREPGGGELGRIAVAMLRWQFLGDRTAGRMFKGKRCGLCQDPAWHVLKKGIQ